MAEDVARRVFREEEEPIEVASAGVWAGDGQQASTHAVTVAADQGGDLSSHRSQPLTADLLARADLVLTMTRAHHDEVVRSFPHTEVEVHALGEFSGLSEPPDVADPIGGSLEQYEATCRQIERHVRASLPSIRKRLRDRQGPGHVTTGS